MESEQRSAQGPGAGGVPRWQQTQQACQEHRAALCSSGPGPRLQTELRKGWLMTCFLFHCIRCCGCSAVLHTQSSGHQHSSCNCYCVLRDIQALYVRHDQKSFPAITSKHSKLVATFEDTLILVPSTFLQVLCGPGLITYT